MTKKNKTEKSYESLIVEGVKYTTKLTDKYKARKPYQEENLKVIISFISGTIGEVFVKENDRIVEGQPLLTLEAMKMKNNIQAPIDGVVKKVNVKNLDKVIKGQLLIELE